MLRLIEKGLMFGNLVKVSTPALVDRYNAALAKITGQRTGLSDFHVDLSGYSPEIGQELGDDLYLNPNGCNRMFILLVPEQYQAPLLGVHFSASRSILQQFYQQNAKQLFALTARDAVCGELMNSVYRLDQPADVLSIRTVTVEADTVSGHIGESRKLNGLIERFTNEDDGWWSDLLVAEMIQSASTVGDIGKNPVELSHSSYRQGNFQTTHFGGLYVFHELKSPAVIRVEPQAAPGQMPIASVIDLADRKGVSDFLKKNRLVETVFDAKGLDAPALLRQRIDFMLVDHLARDGADVAALSRAELRRAMRRHLGDLPPEGQALAKLVRWAEQGGKRPRLDHRNPAYFYTLRARAHADRDLVNMLLAELTPKDVRQLFICHKEAFYAAYSTWSDAKRTYVVDFLASEFLRDKQGTWEALYGPDEPMVDEPEAEKPKRREEERRTRRSHRRQDDRRDDDDDDDDDDERGQRRGPWGIPIRKRRGRGPWGRHE
ncbi:MAG: hypothetical protein OEN23_05985 [Paracoccaceae bacterium]|nr:hypothetical protein [Paracoccaceae bacterium]